MSNSRNKKNVYMIQINTDYVGAVYLPYAIGSIAAYAWGNETIKTNYCLKPFIYQRSNIDLLVESIKNPFIAAFSGYIWNFEFNKLFAKKIKDIYPECIVVFGGHSTPGTTEFLDSSCYIDYLILGEGEEPFTELLCAILRKEELYNVSNIIYRDSSSKAIKSRSRIITRTDYPSPYVEGYFNNIIKNDFENKFSIIIETNRGCPYGCSYCDWGMLNKKIRFFPLEKVFSEIDWLADNKIEYVFCADANFGIVERDKMIAKKIVDVKEKTGYPQKFSVNFTKDSNQTVFEINKKLNKYGLNKGATLSFQSLSPTVLENIKRTNITFDHFSELMTLYNSQNIMTYSELILGLPGETYESFAMSLGKLLEAGQHTSIIVLNCYLLANAEMNTPDYIKKHKIETVSALPHQIHHALPKEGDVLEYSQVVVSTATMSREMWVLTELLSFCVQSFHCCGLLQYFAIFLFYEHGVKYEEFYEQLLTWLTNNPETISGKVFSDIQKEIIKVSQNQGLWFYYNDVFGNITWPFEEGMFLELAYHNKRFYSEIIDFLKSFKIDPLLFDELLHYQKEMLKLPIKTNFESHYVYDFHKYFSDIYKGSKQKLRSVKNVIKIKERDVPDEWDKYAIKIVWYGRRGGSLLYTDVEQTYS